MSRDGTFDETVILKIKQDKVKKESMPKGVSALETIEVEVEFKSRSKMPLNKQFSKVNL